MSHTFLLELGLEEMPAKGIKPSVEQLKDKVATFLNEAKLDFQQITTYSTPRRLALMVEGLAEMQADEVEMVKGPAKKIALDAEGNWSKAAIGFTRGQGATPEEIVFKEIKGVDYIFVEKFTKGKRAEAILSELSSTIASLTFPVSMKWSTHSYKFIRPLHWLVAMLDQEVLPLTIFDVQSGNNTIGHRFLGETIAIKDAGDYAKALEGQFVIADREKRQQMIKDQMTAICEEKGWKVPLDNIELLNEVTDLVEYPTAFSGSFDQAYLSVPEMALEVSMADHQRYFPVRKNDETMAFLPNFIGIRNGSDEYIDTVVRGNEKVLTARLADAKFFYEEDQKITIDAFVEKLKRVSFHEKLGSMYDKQHRVSLIAQSIADQFSLSYEEKEALKRAGELFKFDLVTGTVVEFTKLQGEIGAILASEKGESALVCSAIAEQYKPTSATGAVPSTKVGTVLSLADKFDTLAMFFAIGQIPSGSNDPFALRRQAMGIVRMIQHAGLNLELSSIVDQIEETLTVNVELKAGLAQNKENLLNFFKDRVDQLMQSTMHNNQPISHDIRQAALNANQADVVSMMDTALVLSEASEENNYKSVIESLNRVANLAQKASDEGQISVELLKSSSEKTLYDSMLKVSHQFETTKDANSRYEVLTNMSNDIDAFFEENMVMADDEAVKANRLALLKAIDEITKGFADTTQLIIK
ncbi:glycine--tRNA ligase subunit beta [Marinilactibacillus kalidii]|uniref:glycine--tRNA ligase subunit beta n=1 Tax=Marinilactibacillus kalidii TaxID=2820274 RepID=UPI001ABDEF8D|nr:glycine--tRNA ligase subunit beta [Marinilactibacillus kalidii]